MPVIENLLEERILILDGAMGTMIQRHQLQENDYRKNHFDSHHKPLKGNNDLLCITRPEIIKEIHEAYLEAGADIIETNTFSGTSIAQADYDLQHAVKDINYYGAKIAKEAALKYSALTPEKPRFVAGSIGPTNRTASISPDVNNPAFRTVTFDELVEAYAEQIYWLMEGGADILLIETVFDTLNAKAALFAAEKIFEQRNEQIPIMVSGTITDASGRLLSGQTPEAFIISIEHAPLLSVGLNCALGAAQLKQYLSRLAKATNLFISAHPNAGLPNEFGEYDETPEAMAQHIKEYLEEGLVNIIGGCCGTTPAHIKMIAELARQYSPRTVQKATL
ncbi:MAG: 5-methyltetrahydrofolate--homocysteine methyltransferase [Bacteroidetes bacterium]|nr:MAG: 5-methyltetrahydrofolate--homocysteine methyltransferase [Bacteroidota bacterium]